MEKEMTQVLLTLSESDLSRDLNELSELQVYPQSGDIDVKGIKIIWAPFGFFNPDAGLAIIGVTPGPTQALLSYKAIRQANENGEDPQDALRQVKAEASFRGFGMETNLKSLLEHSGVSERAGIEDVDLLWTDELHKVHFTSTIRHPTYINDKRFNNQINSLNHPELRRYVDTYLVDELRRLPRGAEIVVLGAAGPEIVRHAANIAKIDAKRIVDLTHPSTTNHGRVRRYLSETRTKSERPCRCMLCEKSRIPNGWDLSEYYTAHKRTHGRSSS